MKFVVIGEPPRASMEALMAMFSPHKAVVDAFFPAPTTSYDNFLREIGTQYVEGYTAPIRASMKLAFLTLS